MTEELVTGHHLDAESFQQPAGVPARGLHGNHGVDIELLDVVAQPLLQGVGPAVVDLETLGSQLRGEVGHRGQDEMEPLAMPPPGGDQRCALHQQHTAVSWSAIGERSGRSGELVAEHPDGRDGHSEQARRQLARRRGNAQRAAGVGRS